MTIVMDNGTENSHMNIRLANILFPEENTQRKGGERDSTLDILTHMGNKLIPMFLSVPTDR